MKLFLILTIFLFSHLTYAGNWVPLSEWKTPSTMYSKKSLCELAEAEACFDRTGVDHRRTKIGVAPIVILETVDCDDSPDCSSMVNVTFSCPTFQTAKFDDKANWPGLDFDAIGRPATGWFLWCEESIVVADPAGDTQADTDDAQEASDNAARATAKTQRDIDLDACVADTVAATLTLPDASACIRALVREIRGSNVPISDL